MDLDTPLSQYLKATYDLALPARFYNPKTLKPIVKVSLAQIAARSEGQQVSSPRSSRSPSRARPEGSTTATGGSPLVVLFERSEGHLSISDIADAFILDNMPSGRRTPPGPIVEALKAYGLELSTRFAAESKYTNYSAAYLESDRAIAESTFRAQKSYEKMLSDGIQTANAKIAEYPVSELTKPEIQQSNMVFTRVSWNADNVDLTKIRDRDVTVQPIVDHARLTNEDAPDLFTLFPVSGDAAEIPYLGYHTPNSNQYRVATTTMCSVTRTAAAGTKLCAVHPDKDEYTYQVISNSDLYNDLRGSTSFLSFMIRGVFGLLDLSHSTLILNRVHRDAEQSLTEQVISLLPFLRIEGLAHRRITARVVSPIGGSIAYHVLFFDVMLNQADYIGFKEEDGPQLLKPTKTFYLSPIPRVIDPMTDKFATVRDIHVVMANRVSANSELMTLDRSSGAGAPHELTRGTPYVEFMIYDVSDVAMLKFTMAYLSRMVGHYHEVAAPEYGKYIQDEFHLSTSLGTNEAASDAVYSRTSTHIRGIDLISHAYPEVFGHNYTRQCPHYPTVKQHLDPDDVEYHPRMGGAVVEDGGSKSRAVVEGRKSHERASDDTGGSGEWLKYPPDGGIEFYFRCGMENSDFSYPSVIVSKLRNRTKYPVVPCCARTNQFRPGLRTEVAYRLGGAQASSVSATDITVTGWGSLTYPPSYNERLLMASEKTLYRGRLGRIPEALLSVIVEHLLPTMGVCSDGEESEPEGEDGRRLVRLGLSEPNMIHAAFLAADPAYQELSAGTAAERLNYLKKHIGENLPYPACLYQELPASQATREALMYEDTNNPAFASWNSISHYRILEEILDINLYILIRVSPRENVIEPNRYYFEIPTTRSGAPHMRRHRSDRQSVILYRVRRFEGDVAVDSGTELLLHGTRKIPFSGLWGTGCTKRIADLYSRSAQVLSFGTSPIKMDSYVASVGLYTADYARTLEPRGCVPVSQLIDERGLCRALTMELPKERLQFSIVFPATQPYNLPFEIRLRLVHYDHTARMIFGDACMTSFLRDGVFYILGDDPTRWIFVPLIIDDETLPLDIPKTQYTPMTGLSPSAVDYSVQWRTAHTYLRVLLFMVAFLYTFTEPLDPSSFMKRYIVLDESRHAAHVSDVYDFSGLKRILVLHQPNMKEALATIRRLAPTLLDKKGEKLVLTSQKIVDAIEYYVRTVHDQAMATPLTELRKRRWDLASVIAPIREGGASATLLLAPAGTNREALTLNFGSARAVRTWFRGLRSGATSGSMIPTSDSRAVMEIVKGGIGIILFRHPKTSRVWLIPGITESLKDAVVICYLWVTQHRVVELDTQSATSASLDRLAVQSGIRPAGRSRITAMFRPKTVSGRRSRGSRVLVADEDDLPALRRLVDSANIIVNRYVITRDNRIELLAGQEKPSESSVVVEVLRTGPNRFTPMLSP